MRMTTAIILSAGILFGAAWPAGAATLDSVRERGYVHCGVSDSLPGFAAPGAGGTMVGFEADYCRAIAAAVLGNAEAVRFLPLLTPDRFVPLRSGEIDVLLFATTWTMERDTALGVSFTAINFHDGQGFLARKASGFDRIENWPGNTVCANAGSTTELNVIDFLRENDLEGRSELVTFADVSEGMAAYEKGDCDLYASDKTILRGHRLKLANPGDHGLLPFTISKEPWAPAVRDDDLNWLNIVKWVHFAMVNAEELGVTAANVDAMGESGSAAVRRLLGVEGGFGPTLGLAPDWAEQVIRQVGNYGEVYDRHLGPGTPLDLPRGLNALWNEGGVLYAPPIR